MVRVDFYKIKISAFALKTLPWFLGSLGGETGMQRASRAVALVGRTRHGTRRASSHRCQTLPGEVTVGEDFEHHKKGLARLNHGSFGACPGPVLRAQDQARREWLAEPDAWYFGGILRERMLAATRAAAAAVCARPDDVCLVENLSVATAMVASRWGRLLREQPLEGGRRSKILVLNWCYRACHYCLEEHCGRSSAEEGEGPAIVEADIPFPLHHAKDATEAVARALKQHQGAIRFAFLDHTPSQPTAIFNISDMIQLCREEGVQEVAVDGAHAIGSISELDIPSFGADIYMSNIHKWGMAPHSSALVHARPALMAPGPDGLRHPVVSWGWQKGALEESLFTGTRDYSALAVVPDALQYLDAWRSIDGLTVPEFNRRGVLAAADMLQETWAHEGGGALGQPRETVSSMAMVELPKALRVDDTPGEPTGGDGVRAVLRERWGVEVATGSFPTGNYVRLSHAVYNQRSDYERLRDAVLELLQEQRAAGLSLE